MYRHLSVLLFFSSTALCGAQHKFKPFFDKFENAMGDVYDLAASPYTRITAMRIKRGNSTEYNYKAEYTLNPYQINPKNIIWVEISEKDAPDVFSKLEQEYKTYSDVLDARKKKKVKMEVERDRSKGILTTTYTQTKNDITRSASRVLMPSGKKFFGSFVKGAKNSWTSEELFEELAEKYRRENPA